MSNSISDFDAAKAISEQLKDMDKERQQRILRWVAESLGLPLHIKAHEGHVEKPAGHEQVLHIPPPPSSGQVDVKIFVNSKKPKSDVQFATTIAYYYQFEANSAERKQTIDSKMLQDAARLCGRDRFKRPLMTLTNAKNQGYLDAAGRGEFRINTVGENLVAMTLPGSESERKSIRRSRKAARKRSRTAKKARRQASR